MRTTLIALLASASIVSASGCARNNIEDLVAETSCGSIDAIANCLGAADLQRLDEIERCYSSNGCGDGAATVEAVWFAKDCQPLDNGRGDLRRRADSTTEDSTTAKTTAKTTSAKSTSAKTSSTTVASTSATTTADSTTSDSTSSTATTASSTTSTSSSTTTTSTGSTTSGATATGTCSVTSTKSTSSCQTTSGTSTCVATTTEIASCAPGMICFSATAGADVCMKRDDELTTSGLIVTIIFGVALAATAIAFGIMCVRNSAKAKQEQRAQLLAAASSKGNDVEAQSFPNRSEANLPLITPGGTRSEETGYHGASQPQQDYFGQSGSGGNSVTPPGNRGGAPQLHQGLGALGGETRY